MDSRSSAKMSSARELEDDRPVPGHIPDIDWPHIYRQIDPQWEPPPESADEDEVVIERPKLRLILGGAS